MRLVGQSRPAVLAGRALVAILLLAGTGAFAANESPADLLQHADTIKTANNSAFQDLLKQVDTQANLLSPLQLDWLAYLKAWQLGYLGDYQPAVAAFEALLAQTQDPTLRARVRISLLNDQANTSHYEEAYANLNALLDSLPQITDPTAHNLSLDVATASYNQAGQYDLALQYANLAVAEGSDGSVCRGMSEMAQALYKGGKLRVDDSRIRNGIDACGRIGDPLFANEIRMYPARLLIDQGHAADALQLLKSHDAEVLHTHSASTISDYRALMARCYLLAGDIEKAREYAQSAIDYSNKQEYSKPVADAYKVLYEAAKQQDDFENALTYHEKYVMADRAYLTDETAHTLAYQMVHQQVLDKKRQIDALNEKNRVLVLQQRVDAKSALARRLYILLLLSGLAIVALWAYRTKRSQIKFQKLARRDSLTGICNRQHFFESAQDALRYCAKDAREASVLALDLDHFKSVNDMHGHAAGDAVLKRVVAACQSRLRSIDIFGRLGGEEFAILLPDCSAVAAAQRANEMRIAIAGLPGYTEATSTVVVTASFGVATTRVCGYNLPTLLAHADTALYAAKHAGRNRVHVHRAAAEPAQTSADATGAG